MSLIDADPRKLTAAREPYGDLPNGDALMRCAMHEPLLGKVIRHMIATAKIAVFLQHQKCSRCSQEESWRSAAKTSTLHLVSHSQEADRTIG